MRLSIIVVHYRTPELVAPMVEALRADIEASDLDAEILLVDNGSEPEDRQRFECLPVRYLPSRENLGYSGGVNSGVRQAQGEVVVVMNADVVIERGCLAALAEQLVGKVAVAGPLCVWDTAGRILLPPSEERGRWPEFLRRLATRSKSIQGRVRRRWRARARRHWQATESIDSYDLSGALLAVRREAFDAIGPFDEAYRLYFEETDWLLRARRLGWRGRFVPEARAVHLYDRSGAIEPRSREWFEASRQRFESRHYGRIFGWLTRRIEKGSATLSDAPVDPAKTTIGPQVVFDLDSEAPPPLWVEISPNRSGVPAATERIEARPASGPRFTWTVPDEIWQRLEPGLYRVQLVDDLGVEGDLRWIRREASAANATAAAKSLQTPAVPAARMFE